jgi:hypothetical protein
MGVDFGSTPLSTVAVHLLLAVAALAFTAALWAAAAQTSRSHASGLDRLSGDETVQRVTFPPVVIVGHREEIGLGSTAVAAVSTVDCPNVAAPARVANPFRVTLRQ